MVEENFNDKKNPHPWLRAMYMNCLMVIIKILFENHPTTSVLRKIDGRCLKQHFVNNHNILFSMFWLFLLHIQLLIHNLLPRL